MSKPRPERHEMTSAQRTALYKTLGFDGVQFHDDDVVPGIDELSPAALSRKAQEVKAMLDSGEPVQIIDARPRAYISRQQDIMDGAVWRDPERIQDWIGELSKSDPVVVFCAYGFHVGCKTAIALREAGFDAKYMKGGHSAWKAIGGPLKLYT